MRLCEECQVAQAWDKGESPCWRCGRMNLIGYFKDPTHKGDYRSLVAFDELLEEYAKRGRW